jgi:hypothetical protein
MSAGAVVGRQGRYIETFPGDHMNRLLASLATRSDSIRFDALAVLASAGQWLLGAARRNRDGDVWRAELLIEDWQAAMTLLRLYNAIENER